MKNASKDNYQDYLIEALKSFKCYKDEDVQSFLNDKAINFEKRGSATTYLLLDEESFNNGELKIEAYLSLTHKSIFFREDVSKTLRNKLAQNRNASDTAVVLIGQLGKFEQCNEKGKTISSSLSGKEILDYAIAVISEANELIVNRDVLIECKKCQKLVDIYTEYGFKILSDADELYAMYLIIDYPIGFPDVN